MCSRLYSEHLASVALRRVYTLLVFTCIRVPQFPGALGGAAAAAMAAPIKRSVPMTITRLLVCCAGLFIVVGSFARVVVDCVYITRTGVRIVQVGVSDDNATELHYSGI